MATREQRRKLGKREKFELGGFRKLCLLQPTEQEIAAAYGVSKRTIIRLLKKPDYREVWESGKAVGMLSLRRLQWRHAQGTGSAAVSMTIHLSKHWLGETDKAAEISITNNVANVQVNGATARERVHRKLDAIAQRLTGRVAGIAARAGAQLAPAPAE